MGWNRGKELKHCRWCGTAYYASQPLYKDGFCKPSHKMAHARAYKKYVTRKSESAARLQDLRVTTSNPKKKGKTHGKKTKEKSH